jgi:hypothetical protein
MDELIARIEAASGASRELDWEIHLRDGLDGVGYYGGHPFYTSSVDAALTLIPVHWNWSLYFSAWENHTDQRSGPPEYGANLTFRGRENKATRSDAATPALALCAVALRARQS